MADKVLFHKQTKGSLMENEDEWYLEKGENGAVTITHWWSHVDPYGRGRDSSGEKAMSEAEFRESAGASEKTALDKALADS